MTHKRERGRFGWRRVTLGAVLVVTGAVTAAAQQQAFQQPDSGSALFVANSPNVHLLSHIPLGRSPDRGGRPDSGAGSSASRTSTSRAIRIRRRQPGSRAHQRERPGARQRCSTRTTSPTLSSTWGSAGWKAKRSKYHGRYYYVQCFQFNQGSPDADLGAIVFDVTGLPDTTRKSKRSGRILAPNSARQCFIGHE